MCPSRNVPGSPPISKCECSSFVSKFSTHFPSASCHKSLWLDDLNRITCRALELWGWSVISSYFILLLILLPHFMPCREGGALLSWRRSEGFFTCRAPHSVIAREPEYSQRTWARKRKIKRHQTHTHTLRLTTHTHTTCTRAHPTHMQKCARACVCIIYVCGYICGYMCEYIIICTLMRDSMSCRRACTRASRDLSVL